MGGKGVVLYRLGNTTPLRHVTIRSTFSVGQQKANLNAVDYSYLFLIPNLWEGLDARTKGGVGCVNIMLGQNKQSLLKLASIVTCLGNAFLQKLHTHFVLLRTLTYIIKSLKESFA